MLATMSMVVGFPNRHVREAGGLVIADEIQTGFARMGDYFWAFEVDGEQLKCHLLMCMGVTVKPDKRPPKDHLA